MNHEEFNQAFYEILKRALTFAELARNEGLLALEGHIDHKKVYQRDIFEYGMRFTIDGTDRSIIDKILSNIIKQEKNEMKALLKTIQKEAVLLIQVGYNPRIVATHLNSYTDLPLDDPSFRQIVDLVYPDEGYLNGW
jgi:flagellar motor component MotA